MNDKLEIEQSKLAPTVFHFKLSNPTPKPGNLSVYLDGPPFWTPVWYERMLADHTSATAPPRRKCSQSAMIRKIGEHPLMKPVREWVKAQSGGSWVDAIKCVNNHFDEFVVRKRLSRGCTEVHLTFEDEQLAMLFKLTWAGV